jgi:hypothetical protein
MSKSILNFDIYEKIHFYLSESVLSIINALAAQSPGLDSHAVGCLLKSLRLCQVCTVDKKVTIKFDKFDIDDEFLEKKDSIVICLQDAISNYSNKYCGARKNSLQNTGVLSILSKLNANSIAETYNNDLTNHVNQQSLIGSDSDNEGDKSDDDEDEFSDWDEDEEVETFTTSGSLNRLNSFYVRGGEETLILQEIEYLNHLFL